MSLVQVQGNASGTGTLTVAAPNTNSNYTLTLPTGTGTFTVNGVNSNIVSGTAVASTSGTSIDFTGIPSWVKRITVMLNGVSTSGTSAFLVQLGDSGGVENSGYTGVASRGGTASTAYTVSALGFPLAEASVAASNFQSLAILTLLDSATNTWVITGTTSYAVANSLSVISGGKSLSATLDRIRITTVNGTDTFDAGSINILYE